MESHSTSPGNHAAPPQSGDQHDVIYRAAKEFGLTLHWKLGLTIRT
jgi:hypothetical protein